MFPVGLFSNMINANSQSHPNLVYLDKYTKVIFVLATIMNFSILAIEHISNYQNFHLKHTLKIVSPL